MQTIKKDELFRNLGDFLQSKGVERPARNDRLQTLRRLARKVLISGLTQLHFELAVRFGSR